VTGAGGAQDGGAPADGARPATDVTQLGPDWTAGPDGVLYRRGARLIVLDEDDRVLMMLGHDVDNPGRRWWFTPGGGIDPGESAVDAAVRELLEETGLHLDAAEVVGPVATRSAVFDFYRRAVRQDEEFFLARVDRPGEMVTDGWTDVERAFMDDVRWWELDALEAVDVEVFPAQFVALVRELLGGWDGVVRRLPDELEGSAAPGKG
jgi:8-oxo-dGTP pyrophosphatase MutT (NUDIX family)